MSVAGLIAAAALFVPLPTGVNVAVRPCALPTAIPAQGCAYLTERGAQIDVLRGTLSLPYLDARMVVGHELGHVWAWEHPDLFARYVASAPRSKVALDERFADVYALCSLGPRLRALSTWQFGRYYGSYNELIWHKELSAGCWLIHQ